MGKVESNLTVENTLQDLYKFNYFDRVSYQGYQVSFRSGSLSFSEYNPPMTCKKLIVSNLYFCIN